MFDDANFRLDRARDHMRELQGMLTKMSASLWYELVSTPHQKGTRNGYRIVLKTKTPDDAARFALVVGDALHNLRAALDSTIHEVLTLAQDHNNRHAQFPAYKEKKAVVEAFSNGLKKVPANVRAFIVDQVQPYENGNTSALVALNQLDNGQKHRKLTPLFRLTRVTDMSFQSDAGHMFNKYTAVVQDDNTIGVFGHAPWTITDPGKGDFDILFGADTPFANESMFPITCELLICVEAVINDMEALYPDPQVRAPRVSRRQ